MVKSLDSGSDLYFLIRNLDSGAKPPDLWSAFQGLLFQPHFSLYILAQIPPSISNLDFNGQFTLPLPRNNLPLLGTALA